jgi:hypothetical protein
LYQHESTDYSNPRSLLEEKEQEADESTTQDDPTAMATALGRVLAWLLEAPSLPKVGFRAYVIAHKLRPDLIGGMSFADMAQQLGQGRSSAHKLSKEFATIFGVRGMHDKSEEARRKYRQAWRRTNIRPCPTPNSQPSRLLSAPPAS